MADRGWSAMREMDTRRVTCRSKQWAGLLVLLGLRHGQVERSTSCRENPPVCALARHCRTSLIYSAHGRGIVILRENTLRIDIKRRVLVNWELFIPFLFVGDFWSSLNFYTSFCVLHSKKRYFRDASRQSCIYDTYRFTVYNISRYYFLIILWISSRSLWPFFFINDKNFIFKLKSLNNFMGRKDTIEFYKY